MSARALRVTLAFALALAACSEPPPPPPPVAPTVATLVEAHGTVTLTRNNQTEPGAPGPLRVGDMLVTGRKSTALIRATGGGLLELAEDTHFRITEKLGAVSLELNAGAISIVGDESPGFNLVTPYGETRLAKGTKGQLTVGEGGLGVSVALGSITLVEEDGGQQSAGAGQKFNLKLGAIEIVDDTPAKTPDAGAPAANAELLLTPEAGRPLLKKKGENRFSPAPKEAAAVPEGTEFQLPPGSRARLSTKGLNVHLVPGASGLLGPATITPDHRTLKLGLAAGAASTQFDGDQPTTVVVGGGKKEVQVTAKQEASVVITQTRAGPRVEVQAGEVELDVDGKTTVVKAGEHAELQAGAVKVAGRARPALLLPIDRRVRVFTRGPGEVALALPTSEAPARVQVAADAAFTNLILSGNVSEASVVVPAPAAGELYWQVLDAAGQSSHKGHARFEPDRDRALGETPKSDVEETGKNAVVYFQSELPTLTFTFTPQADAKRYRLKVFRVGELARPIFERDLNETRCAVDSGVLVEGNYVWSASTLDARGNEKTGGRMNKLEIAFDNKLTSLLITHPRLGERLRGPEARASGVAPMGARLFLNGNPVTLDPKGRFSVPLASSETVHFRLLEADGGETYWVRSR